MTVTAADKKAPPGRPLGKSAGAATRGRGDRGAGSSASDLNAVSPQPASRRRQIALTPMRQETAKRMRKLAASVQESHPDMSVHDHLRDAARTLESGNEEASQRHLRAAMFALTPQSLMRNGLHTDDHHQAARQVMHGVHRQLLLVKDITDAAAKNQAAIRHDSYGDDSSSPPPVTSPVRADPNAGYGPGALAQKPTARQPPGNQALNAPNRAGTGKPDPNVADPAGPQPRGSKQFSYGWGDLSAVIELAMRPKVVDLVGPRGFIHGWIYVGGPGLPSVADHNAKLKAKGVTPPTKAHPALTSKPPSVKAAPKAAAPAKAAPEVKTPQVKDKAPAVPPTPKSAPRPADATDAEAKAKLQAALKSGIKSSKRVGGGLGEEGQESDAHVVTMNDGSQWIHKHFMTTGDQKGSLDREILASKVAKAIGVDVPPVIADPRDKNGMYEPFLKGSVNGNRFADRNGMLPESISGSESGHKVGLLHMLIGEDDGGASNVMVGKDGSLTGIDHNDSWTRAGAEGGMYPSSTIADQLEKDIGAGKSGLTADSLDRMQKNLEALKGDFGTRHAGKYQATMDMLAKVRKAVAGDKTQPLTYNSARRIRAAEQAKSGKSGADLVDAMKTYAQIGGASVQKDVLRKTPLPDLQKMDAEYTQRAASKGGKVVGAHQLVKNEVASRGAKGGTVQTAYSWRDLENTIEFSAKTAALEVTPAPRGKPGGPGLYGVKGMGHTDYEQQIVKALIEKRGMDPGKAYAIARGAIRKWARGGGHVHPEVRAAAGAAEAGELAKQARAKSVHGHAVTWDEVADRVVDLATAPPPAAGSTPKQQAAAKQARVAAGNTGGGQFTKGGGGQPDAHQQHVAHMQHLAAQKSKGSATASKTAKATAGGKAQQKAALQQKAAGYRAQADALIKQRDALRAALASASGKTSSGQAGAKTATTAKTKTTAPAAKTSTAAAAASTSKTPSASSTSSKALASGSTSLTSAQKAQASAQIAQLNTQIVGLQQQYAQAIAQAAKL